MLLPQLSWCGSPSLINPSSFSDPHSILGDSVVKAFVKTVGLTMDHRAYEPATPMGTHGFDLSLEVSLTQLPADFNSALVAAGGAAINLPFVPVPRLNLHKGMGESVDGGISLIYFQGFKVLGFDLKAVVFQPEEGPTWALRFKYTSVSLEIPDTISVKVSTSTYTPELVVSRQLEFADPYIGVGYQYAAGTVSLVPPSPLLELSASGQGGGIYSFIGLGMRLVPVGLKISLEGAYSSAGANALGTKVGFNF